jgi:hypothetical protein
MSDVYPGDDAAVINTSFDRDVGFYLIHLSGTQPSAIKCSPCNILTFVEPARAASIRTLVSFGTRSA